MVVVIPCYNDGATLAEAVASVREQEPCEAVVVDDGSDDAGTLSCLRELAESVTVLRQPNTGVAAARMAGVNASSAPYVFPLDADDALAPGSLTPLADALDHDPGAVLAWGDIEVFGPDQPAQIAVKAASLDPWLITYLNELPMSSLVRRTGLLAVGGWQLRHGYEDWDLWMALAERGWRGTHISNVTLRYRQHGERKWHHDFARHDEAYTELRRRHRPLFAARAVNRRRSSAPRSLKLGLTALDRLPLRSERQRVRLAQLLADPGRVGSVLRRLFRGVRR